MIVYIVHGHDLLPFETEHQPPIPVDLDGPITGQFAMQRVQPPAGDIHFTWRLGDVKGGQLQPKFRRVLGLNARFTPRLKKMLQPFMLNF